MIYAPSGTSVVLVLLFGSDGDYEDVAVFSDVEKAKAWSDAQEGDGTAVCVNPIVVDNPEIGNMVMQ